MSKLYLRETSLLDTFTVLSRTDSAEIEQAHDLGFVGNTEDLAIYLRRINGPSWSVAHAVDHSVVAIGGFERLRRGVYRSWFFAQNGAFELYGRELSVICARSIRNLLRDGAHRVETVSLSNRAQAHEWYERIGLTREAEHPGYGVTGQAAVTYVRIR